MEHPQTCSCTTPPSCLGRGQPSQGNITAAPGGHPGAVLWVWHASAGSPLHQAFRTQHRHPCGVGGSAGACDHNPALLLGATVRAASVSSQTFSFSRVPLMDSGPGTRGRTVCWPVCSGLPFWEAAWAGCAALLEECLGGPPSPWPSGPTGGWAIHASAGACTVPCASLP